MERLTVPDEKIGGGRKRVHIVDTRAVREEAMTIYWALKKYEDLEVTPEQIREMKEKAIIPPCKIDDTVYVLMKRCNVTEIVKGTVKKVYSTIPGIWWIEFRDLWLDVEFKDFGETAFLTREEAESKLAEMEGNHE